MARKKDNVNEYRANDKLAKVVVSAPDDIKNARGAFGPICNTCAGFGFTYSFLDGKQVQCIPCAGTGVPKVDLVDLQKQVIELTRLVKALYGEMKKHNLTVIT